jgi:hypothetical protein
MNAPALALVSVLPASTGIGANTGPNLHGGHRHHAARETANGKQESGEPGRFTGQQWPGASIFLLSFHPGSRQDAAGSCP